MGPPRTMLCPGYTHVSAFSPSLSCPKSKLHSLGSYVSDEEDEEYEEEIEYVILDLGNIEPTLVPSSTSYRLIGLDTPTPFLQLSGTILRGRHENLLGSELVFTDDKGPKKRGVTHAATTSKRITFKEVQLRPKDKPGPPTTVDLVGTTRFDDGEGESEGEGLEYHDTEPGVDVNMDIVMDIDDALEYVDLDAVITDVSNGPSQAGPSCLPAVLTYTPVSVPTSADSPPAQGVVSSNQSSPPSQSAPVSSFTSFISGSDSIPVSPLSKGKGEDKISDEKQVGNGEGDMVDPALRIDRLAGISPPLTRAPRGSKKASGTSTASISAVAGGAEEVGGLSKGKGKGKQKAKATHVEDDAGRDMT